MTTKVGIIGWPLTVTFSPVMHNAAFEALGMDWQYEAMAIPPDIVRLGLKEPQRHGFVGLNVTIPHKEAVMPFIRPDPVAQAIGAVNTIDLRIASGTNTDVQGFIDDLLAHDVTIEGQKVLVIGAGGAARAAVFGLTKAGADVLVTNRTVERAKTMLANLSLHNLNMQAKVIELNEISEYQPSLIVNCTPVGMYPKVDASPVPDEIILPEGVTVYDMIYRPAQTKLMQQAEAVDGRGIGGLGMLVRQGALSFEQWTQRKPPIDVMFDAVQSELDKLES